MKHILAGSLPSTPHRREGGAFVIIIATLALISAVMATTAWQMTASRRVLERRQAELQADWLARAGMEIAVAHLLSSPEQYRGESVEMIPHSQVHIEVAAVGNSAGEFQVVSEARYPTDSARPVTRSVRHRVRRVTEQGKARVKATIEERQ